MFYALNRASLLDASSNAVRFALVAAPPDSASLQLSLDVPTGTVFQVHGSTLRVNQAESSPPF